MFTPWGRADFTEKVADGITAVSTPSHGGYRLAADRQANMPDALRVDSGSSVGWYEEDCDWALVAVAFPEEFLREHVAEARETVKQYHPDRWEAWTGEKVTAAESSIVAQREYTAAHTNDWVTVAALNQRNGMVGVWATLGGERRPGDRTRHFLVTHEDYDARPSCLLGMVIDLDRHVETDEHFQPLAVV